MILEQRHSDGKRSAGDVEPPPSRRSQTDGASPRWRWTTAAPGECEMLSSDHEVVFIPRGPQRTPAGAWLRGPMTAGPLRENIINFTNYTPSRTTYWPQRGSGNREHHTNAECPGSPACLYIQSKRCNDSHLNGINLIQTRMS